MVSGSTGTIGLVSFTCSSVYGGLSASQAKLSVLGLELESYCSLGVRFRGQRPALGSGIGL